MRPADESWTSTVTAFAGFKYLGTLRRVPWYFKNETEGLESLKLNHYLSSKKLIGWLKNQQTTTN